MDNDLTSFYPPKGNREMNAKSKKMTCVIYARQSSGKEEKSESVEQQILRCGMLAKSREISILGTFKDCNTSGRTYPVGAEQTAEADGVFQKWFAQQTSVKKYRDGLGDAIKLFPQTDYLIIDDITRLYRPCEGSYLGSYIYSLITEHKIKILLGNNGQLVDLANFGDRMSTNVLSSVNDSQLALQKQKSMDAKRAFVDSGIFLSTGRIFGIINKGNKVLEVDPAKAEVIKYIFEETAKYRPYQQIINECQEKFGDQFFNGNFYMTNFRHMARQPLYCGYMYNSSHELIRNKQMEGQEIITYDLWKKVQEIMAEKRKSPHRNRFRVLPFSKLLICGNCGAKLVSGYDKGQTYYYCNQGANTRHDPKCAESRIAIGINRPECKEYTGLAEAISPLLLLAQYHMLQRNSLRANDEKKIGTYQAEYDAIVDKERKTYEMVGEAIISFTEFKRLCEKDNEKKKKIQIRIADIVEYTRGEKAEQRRTKAFFCSFEKLISADIEQEVYESLLRETVSCIEVFYEHIIIKTKNDGTFRLNRYVTSGNRRHFPKFTWKRIGSKGTNEEDNIKKCKYEVTYHYNNSEGKTIIVDFSVLKMYSKGTMDATTAGEKGRTDDTAALK